MYYHILLLSKSVFILSASLKSYEVLLLYIVCSFSNAQTEPNISA